jgi:hypothetical protein
LRLFFLFNYFFIHKKVVLLSTACASNINNTLLIHIAENSDTIIPRANIRPNPLIRFTQNINNIIATINHVKFESQIADHDCLKPIAVASLSFFHFVISTLILSNIRIFASIAIPIDNIKPAIDASVNTIQSVLIIDNTITTYKNKATEATKPHNLYTTIKNKNIIANHVTHAITNFSSDSQPILESIVFSLVRIIGAGTTHVLISLDNAFASAAVY